jgi:alpha-galactosidase
MKLGLLVEPENVNANSEIYAAHPDWILHAGANGKEYPRIQQRNQHILDLSLREVQDHLIKVIGDVIASTAIAYIKWTATRVSSNYPNHQTGRITPLMFRAHVAMMCGSVGPEPAGRA